MTELERHLATALERLMKQHAEQWHRQEERTQHLQQQVTTLAAQVDILGKQLHGLTEILERL